MSVDPAGDRLLYVQGHNPPALWGGALGPGHLVDTRRLIVNSEVGTAW